MIVGGGAAGWLTAALLAKDHCATESGGVAVTLVESPSVAILGVGEGTWPTMRETLRRGGLSEREFITECDASFKQGTRFDGWRNGAEDDRFYHPFTAPAAYGEIEWASLWKTLGARSYADAACAQTRLCDQGRAPKQFATPDYAAVATYGYHLDAVKFAGLLKRHCIDRLGVHFISDHVAGVEAREDGSIAAIVCAEHGPLSADLFVDCSGMGAILIGRHFDVGFVDRGGVLPNDSALAVQLPYEDETAPIASQTISTAQEAGWIWDIGLPGRRGVGYVYASAFASEEQAARTLSAYVARTHPNAEDLVARSARTIKFESGYRRSFWRGNCVAVGMAAGFIEPLEASALVMIELSAEAISRALPRCHAGMAAAAARFNEQFSYRWERIIDFLKLHYTLSRRREPYWAAHRDPASTPDRLRGLLADWVHQPPSRDDFPRLDEIFSAPSYHYILYGMDFETEPRRTAVRAHERATHVHAETRANAEKLLRGLPSNRELISHLRGDPHV
jgi:2-polyprenyl-6-methoxyphenol hydroxylase-like FAD-dependent oxidoreductase